METPQQQPMPQEIVPERWFVLTLALVVVAEVALLAAWLVW